MLQVTCSFHCPITNHKIFYALKQPFITLMNSVAQAFCMCFMGSLVFFVVVVLLSLVPLLWKLPAWRRGLLDNLEWGHPKGSSLTYLRVILHVARDFPRLLTGTPTRGISRWFLHMTTSGFLLEHHFHCNLLAKKEL